MAEFPHVPRLAALNVETAVVLGSALAASLAAVRFQAFERFCHLVRRFEYMQLDEVMIIALVLSLAFLYLFIVRDLQVRRYIREMELQRTRAVRAAHVDELTGLPNRRALTERLRSIRCGAAADMTVLMLDLDGFKAVNDRHGHETGDDVLRCVADRLRHMSERWPGMLAARLGGDEFACVIQPGISGDALERLASNIVQELTAPMPQCGGATIGVSVGIASNANASNVGVLLRRADDAMYCAKRAGGSCFQMAQTLYSGSPLPSQALPA
ncbi:GGDEF domain-containing protein [Novosphingobium sp. 9U]|uniref:GGDEF domain-containing protein n=1 Tax=Novosphingobium sp. 9U TaxID=2653158 RepID=UPI0012F31966|nr:GGDEF domain-containing protein [Novosphingobium sp. 9U]VWX46725.1 putative Diguanylate cyclase [Novosphingobium sp. 9U]